MGKLTLIALIQSGNEEQSEEDLRETIRRELQTNPFWRKWEIEKITIMETATHEQPVKQST
ncbi:MAG: hypothetical protein ABSF09_14055 [Candidatus Bathyarchaeia archaeon]